MAADFVVLGDDCEATGHPTDCQEPAPGTVDGDPVPITIDGTAIATRSNATCTFPDHAHAYRDDNGDGSKECVEVQSHMVVTDQQHPITHNGSSVVLETDTTTDPGSGGTVTIVADGGNGVIKLAK